MGKINKRRGFGLDKSKRIYKFDESHLPDKLSNSKVTGKDTRTGRFILVYTNSVEKEFYKKILEIDGKKVIYSIKDFK